MAGIALGAQTTSSGFCSGCCRSRRCCGSRARDTSGRRSHFWRAAAVVWTVVWSVWPSAPSDPAKARADADSDSLPALPINLTRRFNLRRGAIVTTASATKTALSREQISASGPRSTDRLRGELRGLGDVLHHRREDQGGAQSQRRLSSACWCHTDPDRIADTPWPLGIPHGSLRAGASCTSFRCLPWWSRPGCCSYATEYWEYLVLGLFVGVAGGSFAVGIAYTSAGSARSAKARRWAIFGAGNAGSSLTKFIAPMIIAASATASWRAVSEGLCGRHAGDGDCVLVHYDPGPLHRKDAQQGRKVSEAFGAAVALGWTFVSWRFGLAYYFVFGAFVALALWLPKYYVGEFGLAAGHRCLPDDPVRPAVGSHPGAGRMGIRQMGRQHVTWWVMWISLICMFLLSYPPTTMIVHGNQGRRRV